MTTPCPSLARLMSFTLAVILAGLAAACQDSQAGPTGVEPTQVDPAQIYTQAAQTVIAQFTQAAGSQTATFTSTTSPNPSPALTSTPSPLPSETPVPTLPLTDTPAPSLTPTETTLPCNQAQFIRDVTIPDNTLVSPGAGFIKIWQLRNIGNCVWTPNYDLVFVSGESFGFSGSVSLQQYVYPGDIVNVSTYLTAPSSPGFHRGGFMLRADDGSLFGISTEGFDLFWIQVNVVESDFDFTYDFATNFCLAQWENQDGRLSCPGSPTDLSGFVVLLQSPSLESHQEDEPAIWSEPPQVRDGWIRGTFPPVWIDKNERFLADIGCLDDYPDCDVVFQLNYRIPGGVIHNLGEWREVSDGKITRVDLDLSRLEGRSVEFILTVLANGSPRDDAAFWLVPHLEP